MDEAGRESAKGGLRDAGSLDAAEERIRRLEGELGEQRSMLHAIFNSTPDFFILKDIRSVYRMVNPAFCRFLGKREEEIIGHTDDQLFPARDAELYIRGDVQVMQTLEPEEDDWEVEGKEGLVWLSVIKTPVFDDEGVVTGVLCSVRNVTERRRSEEQLQLWANAFNHCAEGIAIGNPALKSIITCNQAFATMHGMEIGELEGRGILDLYVPEDREKVLSEISRLSADESVRFESLRIHKDGHAFPVLMSIVSIKDSEGHPLYHIATLMDLTKRKEAEKALSESEAKFRSVVESAPEAIFIQTGGCFAWLNPAAIALYRASFESELLGRPVLDRIHPDFKAIVAERIRILNNERIALSENEQVHVCCDGSRINVEVSGLPFVYQGKNGALVFVRNITDRKKTEHEKASLQAQLFQSQKIESIGRLAGGVAHDLNNLLTPILGYTEMLSEQFSASDPRLQQIQVMHQAALRGRELIGQLLAFSRNQPVEFRKIDLNGVIRGFEPLLRRTLREDITIRILHGKGVLTIQGDVGLLEQIIMNLAVNAQDAMPLGGELVISTSEAAIERKGTVGNPVELDPGRFAVLDVRDSGSGMDTETQSHIFEPFFTTKEKGHGTGLGLSTVYGIVRQHGGAIQVQSQTGKGAVFTLWFPLLEHLPDAEQPPEKKSRLPKHRNESILVVEDDEMVRKFVVQVLKQNGYTVMDTSDGETALELIENGRFHPDLLLTDLVLPGMNGLELFGKMRARDQAVRVAFMSGYTQNILSGKDKPDFDFLFLQKPFSANALEATVIDILGHNREKS